MKKLHKLLLITTFLLVLPPFTYAQSSLSGVVSLDGGVASKDYRVTVEVRTHTLDFVQSCITTIIGRICSFDTVYPVVGTNSTVTTIRQGTSSANYRVRGINRLGLRFSVRYLCADCDGVEPTQFYTPSGGTTSFSDAVILEASGLPASINFELMTTTSISGTISLKDGALSKKKLDFSVSVLNAEDDTFIRGLTGFSIAEGENSTTYQVARLSTVSSVENYKVRLVCLNCSQEQTNFDFPQILESGVSHSDINLVAELPGNLFLPPLFLLLLDDE